MPERKPRRLQPAAASRWRCPRRRRLRRKKEAASDELPPSDCEFSRVLRRHVCWSLTQVNDLWFGRSGGGGRFLPHMAAAPRPAGVTPEVIERETVQSHRGEQNFGQLTCRKKSQLTFPPIPAIKDHDTVWTSARQSVGGVRSANAASCRSNICCFKSLQHHRLNGSEKKKKNTLQESWIELIIIQLPSG